VLEKALLFNTAKVDVLRDSNKLLVTPNQEFERQFGGKTVLQNLAGGYKMN
jgi:hypothetical protein